MDPSVRTSPEPAGGLSLSVPALDGGAQGHRTLAEKAFETLHAAIITGQLRPGTRLPIEELAQLLRMSPMPIREAQRLWVLDQYAEHAATTRKIADRAASLLVEPRGDEPRQLGAALVEDTDSGVAGPRHLARCLKDAVEHEIHVELGDETAADVEQTADQQLLGGCVHPSTH